MEDHQRYLEEQFNSRLDVLEHMVDEFRDDDHYTDNPSAQRAISVALTQLQTARMWINKAIYSEPKEDE